MALNPTIVLLSVVLLLLRELEQVATTKAWLARDERRLHERSPAIAEAVVARVGPLSTAALAVIAAEELIIITMLALSAIQWELRELWAGLLVTWGGLAAGHLMLTMAWRLYLPGTLSTILSLPFFPIAWSSLNGTATLDGLSVAKWALAMTILAFANGALSRRLAVRFETWLRVCSFLSREEQQFRPDHWPDGRASS
jgi:hypothetical protein